MARSCADRVAVGDLVEIVEGAATDLAVAGAREGRDVADLLGLGPRADSLVGCLAQRIVRVGTITHHESDDALAPLGVVDTGDRDLVHVIHGAQHRLEVIGPELLAAGGDHVAQPSTHADATVDHLAGYRTVLLGGARPARALAENVVTTWGMTETGSGVVYDGVALPGVELAIVGEELCVRSPTLFARYRDRPRPRAVGPDGRDDWFPTGDAGRLDGGRLTVFGRLGYVINTGGEKVWPEDLEAVLARVEGVSDVAVTGRADDEWGERVVALVVAERRDLDGTLRAAAEEAIGPWAKPKEIRYVTAIPRTTSGKVRRGDLAHVF